MVSVFFWNYRFQSTHLHEVWPWYPFGCRIIKSFNPHTYMRCDLELLLTMRGLGRFQSTHLHEVWLIAKPSFIRHSGFNPHTYMRCDSFDVKVDLQGGVSIHTPTWGVTILTFYLCLLELFQSTHLHEVWPCRIQNVKTLASFNPHTYMRCDSGFVSGYCCFKRFNPHTYMRCDELEFPKNDTIEVSIHTPTWGVTCMDFNFAVWFPVSIHTPTWGVTK